MSASSLRTSAIPGNPPAPTPLPLTDDAIERALEGARSLSRTLGRRDVWACTRPDPIVVHWRASPVPQLVMLIDDPEAWQRGVYTARVIEWRWSVLRTYSDGWFDTGWLPSRSYFGLQRSWKSALCLALGQRPL